MVSRYAVVDNGFVVNIAMAEPEFAQEQGWIPAGNAAIGDIWDGQDFHKPDPQPPSEPEEPRTPTAAEILSQLTADEAERMLDVLVLREVLTPERAEKLKRGK